MYNNLMTEPTHRQIALVVNKVRLGDAKNDAGYWRSRSYQERIDALEQIREEYHRWKADAESGFQRIYSFIKINKRATGRAQDIADVENLE